MSHDIDDDVFLTLNFTDSAIFNPPATPNTVRIPLNFKNPPSLLVSPDSFTETASNDGTIDNSITITVVNSDAIIGDPNALVTALNLPFNLQATFETIDDFNIRVTLEGSAAQHADENDLSDIAFSFDGGLFTSGVKPNDLENVSIDFLPTPRISYTGSYTEDGLIQGAIDSDSTVIITLLDDPFIQSSGDVSSDITIGNLPIGLAWQANILNVSQVEVALTDIADNHTIQDSQTDLTISFTNPNLFSSGVIPEEAPNISIGFFEPGFVTTDTTFKEASANNGSIANEVTITIHTGTFKTLSQEALNDALSFPDLPSYYTPSIRYVNNTNLAISLVGQAPNHRETNNSNVSIGFADDNLFSTGIVAQGVNVPVEYFDSNSVIATGSFRESGNSGTYLGSVLIALDGDTLTTSSTLGTGDVVITNLPPGIESSARVLSSNTIEVILNGNTSEHDVADNRDLIFTFPNPSIFASRIAPSDLTNVPLTNNDPATYTVQGNFTERDDDIGAIDTRVTIALDSDLFESTVALFENISIDNLPVGLNPSYALISPSELTIALKGQATIDHSVDADIQINFANELFQSGIPIVSLETGINFFNQPRAILQNAFLESASNDGTIREKVTLELVQGEFERLADFPDLVTTVNLPTDFTPSYTLLNGTSLEIALEGDAVSHAQSDTVLNFSLSIDASAFIDGADVNMQNVSISFIDPPDLVIDGDFLEDLTDNGSF